MERYATHAARILLGLNFVVFGINAFVGFIPAPPHGEAAGAFLGALAATGYMFPLIKIVEIAAGVALLANRFVPLALVLLAPIVVNIAAFHLLLAHDGYALVALLLGLGGYLAYRHRASYRALLHARDEIDATEHDGAALRASARA